MVGGAAGETVSPPIASVPLPCAWLWALGWVEEFAGVLVVVTRPPYAWDPLFCVGAAPIAAPTAAAPAAAA